MPTFPHLGKEGVKYCLRPPSLDKEGVRGWFAAGKLQDVMFLL